jgi:hypothetical protein
MLSIIRKLFMTPLRLSPEHFNKIEDPKERDMIMYESLSVIHKKLDALCAGKIKVRNTAIGLSVAISSVISLLMVIARDGDNPIGRLVIAILKML